MKLGARIFKTGLAVMLSLYIAIWVGLEPPMFAALAATFAIQPSIYRSFQTILEQVQANIIGAILAIVFVLTFGHDPFVVSVVVIIAIAIILKLKFEASTIPIAIVTIIVIMESPTDHFIEFAGGRFLLILIGVIAAFIVNLLFIPPRYETKLFHQIEKHTEETIQWIRLFINKDADTKVLKKDISRLNEAILKTENTYLLYKEERNYLKKNTYAKGRKVVLFRQMIAVLKKAQFLLKNLEQRENEINQLPEPLYKSLREQLSLLTTYHDRILLRYLGKVTSSPAEEFMEEMKEGKNSLMKEHLKLYHEAEADQESWWLHILPIISHVVEYEEKLEHLDQLIDSFFNYHQEENIVKIDEME